MFYQGVKILRFGTQYGWIWYVKKLFSTCCCYELWSQQMWIWYVHISRFEKRKKKLFSQKKIAIFDLDSL